MSGKPGQKSGSVTEWSSTNRRSKRLVVRVARRWGENKKRNEARDLLVPVDDWFTEGLDNPDLKEAKALLDNLS